MAKSLKRYLANGLLLAAVAGIASVSASGVVTLYPATLALSVRLSPVETVTQISAEIYPTGGGQPISKSAVASGPAPHQIDVVVDGGDPGDPLDPGLSYSPRIYAYLQNPASSTYLQILKNNPVLVDNTPAQPSVTVPVSFDYPNTHRANVTITVIGGTVSSYSLYASGGNGPANETYSGYTYSGGGGAASITNWVPMTATSSAVISANVNLVDGQGTASQRSLAGQVVDLSAADGSVSWTIDLTGAGTLAGSIALATSSVAASPTTYQVYYSGASTSSSGVYGYVQADATQPHYTVDLPPGDYWVFLRTFFDNPSQLSDVPWTFVTVSAGNTTIKDFTDSFGVGRIDLEVRGFYGLSDLQSVSSLVRSPTAGNIGYVYQPLVSRFDHTVPVGKWQSYYTYLTLSDQSNPALGNNNTIYRFHFNDPAFPPTDVTSSGIATLGTESITLVKSNVYFDVAEPAGQPQVDVSSANIYAYKTDYNADLSQRGQSSVYSYGTGPARPLYGLTMVAEPGTYTLDARAYVAGTLTKFNGTTITFGEPRDTPAGTGVQTVLTPVQNPALQVTLGFDQVGTGGISTVVETPLGPAPPEGFSVACGQGQTCDPIYYDISSTAQWTGLTQVCVRRQFTNVSDAAGSTLQLLHYNELLQTWEELAPPNGSTSSVNCRDHLAQCGCTDPASCGIDSAASPPQNTFLVCGMASSFSPFAIYQRDLRFTNKVNGVEYTGPTGPPSLQQWVVPADGTYRITAIGARGASATNSPARKGGCGAEVSGDFALHAGDVIDILVGQMGTASAESGGGGGGTFVKQWASPLVVAGGGGGVRAGALVDGRSASVECHGNPGSISNDYTSGFVAGGEYGAGGSRRAGFGAGGGGWNTNGASDGTYGEGGFSFSGVKKGKGGAAKSCGGLAHGGYGGGGAGNGCAGGGGGGGYSGGGGGAIGGGGGSVSNGANPVLHESKCTASGHGLVTITVVGP